MSVSTSFLRWSLCLVVLYSLHLIVRGQDSNEISEDSPLFEFEEFVVNYHPENFAPAFRVESPQFTYFKVPQLERGEIILALEFMDRYREGVIPGEHKWSGLLHFPVIDGEERPHLKWICLYFYNDRMFGYDPSTTYEPDRRFFVPINFEDRLNEKVLFQFANSYVERVFPERQEEIVIYEEEVGYEDEESYGVTEEWETIFIPEGRIAPVLNSQMKKKPEELVRLVYQFSESPNPGRATVASFGPENRSKNEPFTWKAFLDEMGGYDDSIEVAQQLLAPRWSQKLYFHYTKDLWILPDYHGKASALAFNIGTRIYAYSPKYGVWRTKATIEDLSDRATFADKLEYPGLKAIDRVEFIPVVEAP